MFCSIFTPKEKQYVGAYYTLVQEFDLDDEMLQKHSKGPMNGVQGVHQIRV